MPRKIELSGRAFGKLVVLRRERGGWVCRCECGQTTPPIHGGSLTAGMTASCGCGKAQVWTEGEIAFLRDNYGVISASEIAAKLGRSEASVWIRAQKLGIHATHPSQRADAVAKRKQRKKAIRDLRLARAANREQQRRAKIDARMARLERRERRREMAAALRVVGATYAEIGLRLGVSASAVGAILGTAEND